MLALLGMSIASPQAALQHPVVSRIFKYIPDSTQIFADQFKLIFIISILVLISFIIKNMVSAGTAWASARLGEKISLFLGDIMFKRFLYSPYVWHLSGDATRIFQALNGRDSFGNMVVLLLSIHTYSITTIILFTTLLAATPGAILGAVALTFTCSTLIYRFVKGKVDKAGFAILNSSNGQSKSLLNAMNGIREVLIYQQQHVFHKKYMEACEGGSRARSFMAIAPPLPTWILECLGISIIPVSVVAMGMRGAADIASLTVVISLIMLTAWRILPMVNRVLSAMISIRGIRPYFLQALQVFEEFRHVALVEPDAPDPSFQFSNDIVLKDVNFTYPTASAPSLANVSLQIRKGQQVGFVGLSGAGKSTIAGILSGLFNPTGGEVVVDGCALTDARKSAYMRKVGYVPQSPYIMAGTVAENVAFSQWGLEYDKDRVRKACKMASFGTNEADFGIDKGLGDRGAGLSGGQAQRLSLARAFYCEPQILILDESTSSLDQANEDAIINELSVYKGELTIILIAHRLTTLKGCDWLFWLDNGTLKAQGPTDYILKHYNEFMRSQNTQQN